MAHHGRGLKDAAKPLMEAGVSPSDALKKSGKRLLFVVNVDWFFVSHRLPIAQAAIADGFEVHLACAFTGHEAELKRFGVRLHEVPITRSSASIPDMIRAIASLRSLMRSLQPDVVHLVTIKPVLLGGLAARLAGVRHVVAAISGLGYTFISKGPIARARRLLIGSLYRTALRSKNALVIFQNASDADLVTKLAGLDPCQVRMVRGSGVDLMRYRPRPLPEGKIVFTFAARLLVDKGIREFVGAARLLKQKGLRAHFIVAGDVDPGNPASVSQEEADRWRSYPGVELTGHCEDIAGLFARSHVVVLPSYREGLPKVLLEAAACGRAIITTDAPGCRDAVAAGRTALLVPVRAVEALADAMELLAADRRRCAEMGEAGRRLAEEAFGIDQVVDSHLAIYRGLLEQDH
jgi:glycosyltransferase involved in cell wall biosynthesis